MAGEDTESWGSCHHTPKKSSLLLRLTAERSTLGRENAFALFVPDRSSLLNDHKPAPVLDPPQHSADTLGLGQRLREAEGAVGPPDMG